LVRLTTLLSAHDTGIIEEQTALREACCQPAATLGEQRRLAAIAEAGGPARLRGCGREEVAVAFQRQLATPSSLE
jgi:hypothetical protein